MSEFKCSAHPKIFDIDDRRLKHLFDGNIVVEEKVDGSQFVFCKYKGKLYYSTRSNILYDENTNKLFSNAINYLLSIINYS